MIAYRMLSETTSPQFNDTVWTEDVHPRFGKDGPDDARILSYLDETLGKSGPNSAAYISLGSWCWPVRRPEVMINVVESLLAIEPPLPFVFRLPSGDASGIPEALVKKAELSGRGIFVGWAPQVKILQHKATGMFLVSGSHEY